MFLASGWFSAIAGRAVTLILFYNRPAHADLSELPEEDQRAFTSDLRLFDRADAVTFHLPTLKPIASLAKPPGQLWILWSMESVANYPAMAEPALLRSFDIIMTYERSADVWTPYMPDRRSWEAALRMPVPQKTAAAPAVMFQSSAFNRSGRIGYAAELMKAIGIDSFGRVLNNKTLASGDLGPATKRATIGRYKFCIAFENSVCDDYVTEKFFDSLLAGTVPVYLGARNVDRFAPADNCYIDVRTFSGPQQLAQHLKSLDQNDEAYRRLHAWRDAPLRPSLMANLARRGSPFAKLLDAVKARRSSPAETAGQTMVLSYQPVDPSPGSVASFIYDRAAGPARGARAPDTLPMRAARRGLSYLRAARRLFSAPPHRQR